MKVSICTFLAGALLVVTGRAATVTTTYGWNVGQTIPDNDSSGLVNVQTVSSDIQSIDVLTLSVETQGGWNGDLYAYLQHSSGFSVVLNRPGRSVPQPAGNSGGGLNIILDDAASSDIHNAPSTPSPLTGTWQPDARFIDPGQSLDTSPRTSFLSNFNGLDPNGSWTFYVADLSSGGQATLTRWQITVTGNAVPEPGSLLLLAATVLLPLHRRRR